MKASNCSCLPLCPECHTRGAGAYHRIGRRAFDNAQGMNFKEVAAGLQREWALKVHMKEIRCRRADPLDSCVSWSLWVCGGGMEDNCKEGGKIGGPEHQRSRSPRPGK
jgi:hypothetical protein